MTPRALIVGCLVACSSTTPARPPKTPAVTVRGSLREIMHGDDRSAHAPLEGLPAHAHGVGALADLGGEVTLLDGEAWLATPDAHGGVALERTRQPHGGAALLVLADVPAWRRIPVDHDVAPDALDDWLERALAGAGVDTREAVPIRVEGRFAHLAWHVVDGTKLPPGASHAAHSTAGPHGVLDQAEGTLVGFFSRHHAGVFTHMGQASHFHLASAAASGHVDGVTILAGSVLLVP